VVGLLLVNLGTPDAPEPAPVRAYLREFLADPRVLDINPVGRAALLNLVILPRRPRQSAAAYRQVWTDRGSPLMVHSLDLLEQVATRLPDGWIAALGMRYGEPSIAGAIADLIAGGADSIVAFPLYPQYAASSTGTALEEIYRVTGQMWNVPPLHVVPPFYDHPAFIDAFVAVGREALAGAGVDHVLFSYHGLPERHMHKSDPSGAHCLATDDCCDDIAAVNRHCYRAQCYATTRALAAGLELEPDGYSVSFQSRLGRSPWIRPFTDHVLPEMAERGVRRLAVFCPSFVADCLETLEEVAIRGRDQFREAGGEELTLVPSLNSSPRWADAVAALATGAAPSHGAPST
jgi:ferrochelatase